MESLLRAAFNNIASSNATNIRKGLRAIESLLASICLTRSDRLGPDGNVSSPFRPVQISVAKPRDALASDHGFRQFVSLQQEIQCNGKRAAPVDTYRANSSQSQNICLTVLSDCLTSRMQRWQKRSSAPALTYFKESYYSTHLPGHCLLLRGI